MLNYGRLSAVAASIGMLLAATVAERAAHAAWDFVPALGLSARAEDNPLYLPDNAPPPLQQQSASSAALDASIEMATYTERGSLLFEPNIINYQYADKQYNGLESTDYYFTGNGQYRWQKAIAGFVARFTREHLAAAEFGTVDFNLDQPDPNTGETGRVAFIDQYRNFYYLSPYVSFDLSPRNALRFDFANYHTSYSGGDLAFRTGYKNRMITTSLQRNVDERTQVAAVMSVEDYHAEVNTNDFRTVTLKGTFERPINPLWTFNMGAGVLRSDYTVVDLLNRTTSSATTDYVVNVGFRKRSERSNLNFDLGRNVYPSSNGYAVVIREVNLAMNKQFRPRLSMEVGFRLQESRTLGNLNSTNDRNYDTVSMEWDWAIKPVLFLVGGVEWLSQEFPNGVLGQTNLNVGQTSGTSVSIGVRYRGLSKRNPPSTR
jgi:hypothetical protein